MAKGMTRRMLTMIIVVVLLFAIVFGFKAFKGYMIGKRMQANANPPVAVSSIKVVSEPWEQLLSATGSFAAVLGIDVTSEIAGLVRTVNFNDGDIVKKNDLLVALNIETELALLSGYQAQTVLAEINLKRDQAQLLVDAVSKAQVDTDIANLGVAQAQVAQEQSIIAKKLIRAPFAGRLGISTVNPGTYISPGDRIVSLQALDPIYVQFNLPQQNLTRAKVGQTIKITTNAFPGRIFNGKIQAINPVVDNITRNVVVQALVANPKNELLPGIFSNVQITIGPPQKFLTVPLTAISFNPYGEIIYIIKKSDKETDSKGEKVLTVTQSFVTVGETRGDQIQILSGVKEGDVVVTSGQLKLKNGSRVVINNSVKPSNNPNPLVSNEQL